MPDRETLLALADRVEAMDGPDRAVDEAIFYAFYPRGAFDMPDEPVCVPTHSGTIVPRYTSSLDAAMTLVPEGDDISVNIAFGPWVQPTVRIWTVDTDRPNSYDVAGVSESQAQAFGAACLRARAGEG